MMKTKNQIPIDNFARCILRATDESKARNAEAAPVKAVRPNHVCSIL